MEKNIYKNRSISACIKSSFDELIMNFTTIFKKTWIGNLVWTISTTFILLIFAQLGRMLIKNEPLSLLTMLLLLCAFILYCLTSIYMSSKNIVYLIELPLKTVLKRISVTTLIALIVSIAVLLLPFIVSDIVTHWLITSKVTSVLTAIILNIVLLGVFFILIFIFVLPLSYSLTDYICNINSKFKNIFCQGYRTGLRYWGKLFLSQMLTTLCCFIPILILGLPLFILFAAYGVNLHNMIYMGDPDKLPGCFTLLMIVSTIIISFLLSYVYTFIIFVNIHTFGAINQQEKGDKKFVTTEKTAHELTGK